MADSIKPYNSVEWKKQFSSTDIYKTLIAKYDDVYFERFPDHGTLRQQWAISRTSAIPFYYINWIQQCKPQKVYDLGCGWNFFKQYYDNIVGIDSQSPTNINYRADIHAYIDDDWFAEYKNSFEAVFSICSLHGYPLSEIKDNVLKFHSLLKSGGRGWLSLNALRLVQKDLQFQNVHKKVIDDFIHYTLADLPDLASLHTNIFFPAERGTELEHEAMDGNIHILFDKKG